MQTHHSSANELSFHRPHPVPRSELQLDSELMTPELEAAASDPLSAITIGMMEDLASHPLGFEGHVGLTLFSNGDADLSQPSATVRPWHCRLQRGGVVCMPRVKRRPVGVLSDGQCKWCCPAFPAEAGRRQCVANHIQPSPQGCTSQVNS
jgi:hypothetical protein